MKKLIYCAAALATALFAGSCQQELLDTPAGENTVTYTVEVPGVATKAIADGKNVDRLYYEVYITDAKTEADLSNAILLYKKDIPMVTSQEATSRANVTLNLVQNQNYTVLFWAQCDLENPVYDVTDLRNVTYKSGATVLSNHEDYAAFYSVDYISDSTPRDKKVYLQRPFAQLNIGTTINPVDYNKDPYRVALKNSKVTVKNVPTKFNVATSAVDGVAEFTFAMEEVIKNENLVVNNTEYNYVAMNYMFAGANRTATVEYWVEADVTTQNDVTVKTNLNKSVVNVPLKENYRTNIVGNLLTSSTQYEVIVDADWAGADLAPDPIYMAAALGGNVTLTDDVDLTSPLDIKADMTLNLNGKTITGSLNVAAGANVTIENGVVTNVDKNVSGITSNGILTLNNVNVTSARHALRIESGSAVINGGTYQVNPVSNSTLYALNVGDGANSIANVTVKGGKFIGPKGTMADSGGAVTVKVGSTVKIEGGDFSGGKTKTLSADGTLTVAGGSYDQDPTAYVAEGYKSVKKDGKWYVVAEETDAVVTSADELNAALTTENVSTVYVTAGEYTFPASSVRADVTIECEEGTVFTGNSKLDIKGSTVIGAAFSNPSGTAADGSINGTFKNCTFEGSNGVRWSYAGAACVFEDCTFSGDVYGFHVDSGKNPITFKRCEFSGFNAFGGEITLLTFEDCVFKSNGKSNYNGANLWGNTKFINTEFTFDGSAQYEWVDPMTADKTYEFTGCTVNGAALTASNIETYISSYIEDVTVNGYTQVDGLWINNGTAIVTSAEKVQAAFDNREIHTIYLNSGKYVVDMYNGTAARESLTVIGTEGTQFAHSAANEGQLQLSKFDSFTIRNCEILKREVGNKNWGMMVFGGSGKANGVYTVENCTFNGVGTQGIYINEGASGAVYNIKNCTFDGDFGKEGAITIQDNVNVNFTVNVTECAFTNIPSTSHDIYLVYDNGDFTLNRL